MSGLSLGTPPSSIGEWETPSWYLCWVRGLGGLCVPSALGPRGEAVGA